MVVTKRPEYSDLSEKGSITGNGDVGMNTCTVCHLFLLGKSEMILTSW